MITETALEMFKEEGYDNISIPMICKKAKVSKGTFYYHFQSKDEIIHDYIQGFLSRVSDIMPELLLLPSAKEQLWMLLSYACKQTIDMGPALLYAHYRTDMAAGLKTLSSTDRTGHLYGSSSFYKMALNLIEKAQSCGEISRANTAEELMQAFSTIIIGIGLDWACKKGNYDQIETLRRFFDIVFHA